MASTLCLVFADTRRSRQAPAGAERDADREPADMVTRMGQPGADVPATDAKKGKKATRGDAKDASREPADMMSKFRPDPEVELLDDGVLSPVCVGRAPPLGQGKRTLGFPRGALCDATVDHA